MHFKCITTFEGLKHCIGYTSIKGIYETDMSPTLNRGLVIQYFEHGEVLKIHDRMIFASYAAFTELERMIADWCVEQATFY